MLSFTRSFTSKSILGSIPIAMSRATQNSMSVGSRSRAFPKRPNKTMAGMRRARRSDVDNGNPPHEGASPSPTFFIISLRGPHLMKADKMEANEIQEPGLLARRAQIDSNAEYACFENSPAFLVATSNNHSSDEDEISGRVRNTVIKMMKPES